jgi:hypothetical protein
MDLFIEISLWNYSKLFSSLACAYLIVNFLIWLFNYVRRLWLLRKLPGPRVWYPFFGNVDYFMNKDKTRMFEPF